MAYYAIFLLPRPSSLCEVERTDFSHTSLFLLFPFNKQCREAFELSLKKASLAFSFLSTMFKDILGSC